MYMCFFECHPSYRLSACLSLPRAASNGTQEDRCQMCWGTDVINLDHIDVELFRDNMRTGDEPLPLLCGWQGCKRRICTSCARKCAWSTFWCPRCLYSLRELEPTPEAIESRRQTRLEQLVEEFPHTNAGFGLPDMPPATQFFDPVTRKRHWKENSRPTLKQLHIDAQKECAASQAAEHMLRQEMQKEVVDGEWAAPMDKRATHDVTRRQATQSIHLMKTDRKAYDRKSVVTAPPRKKKPRTTGPTDYMFCPPCDPDLEFEDDGTPPDDAGAASSQSPPPQHVIDADLKEAAAAEMHQDPEIARMIRPGDIREYHYRPESGSAVDADAAFFSGEQRRDDLRVVDEQRTAAEDKQGVSDELFARMLQFRGSRLPHLEQPQPHAEQPQPAPPQPEQPQPAPAQPDGHYDHREVREAHGTDRESVKRQVMAMLASPEGVWSHWPRLNQLQMDIMTVADLWLYDADEPMGNEGGQVRVVFEHQFQPDRRRDAGCQVRLIFYDAFARITMRKYNLISGDWPQSHLMHVYFPTQSDAEHADLQPVGARPLYPGINAGLFQGHVPCRAIRVLGCCCILVTTGVEALDFCSFTMIPTCLYSLHAS